MCGHETGGLEQNWGRGSQPATDINCIYAVECKDNYCMSTMTD